MIKVFTAVDKVFDSNGDAVILATKARVKCKDNGDYTLELHCNSDYNEYIIPNNIIVAPTPQGEQAFRIRTVTKRAKKLEVKAWHVFYDASNYLIADSYAVNMTAKQALEHFNAATDITSPFTMDSNVSSIHNMRVVRESLAEAVARVIETWGGHLVRDNWEIDVKGSIGRDNGITIEYKKNLKELSASYNWDNVVTKLMPVGKDGLLLDERYLYSSTQYDIPFTKTVSFNQDIDREDYPSEEAYIAALKEDLRIQGNNYLAVNCVPVINYTLKANPEKITDIGDIIEVKDERIGVNVLTSVIAYEFDAITERYVNLEFGNFTQSLSSLMSDINKETSIQVSNATANINIEVNSLYNDIAALQTVTGALQTGKQDKLTEGSYINLSGNTINCSLSAGQGISIDANNYINLAHLGLYNYKNYGNVYVENNTITLYAQMPRPLGIRYDVEGFKVDIYPTAGSTNYIEITDETTGVTVLPARANTNTVRIDIIDVTGALANLAGVYNAYIELEME